MRRYCTTDVIHASILDHATSMPAMRMKLRSTTLSTLGYLLQTQEGSANSTIGMTYEWSAEKRQPRASKCAFEGIYETGKQPINDKCLERHTSRHDYERPRIQQRYLVASDAQALAWRGWISRERRLQQRHFFHRSGSQRRYHNNTPEYTGAQAERSGRWNNAVYMQSATTSVSVPCNHKDTSK